FFSSRRRHTRSKRDWSSDVCSSDLFFLLRLELQAAFAGALGQLSHAAMENIAAAVKHDLFNALGLGALSHGHADLAGSFLVAGRSEERRVGRECSSRGAEIDVGTVT